MTLNWCHGQDSDRQRGLQGCVQSVPGEGSFTPQGVGFEFPANCAHPGKKQSPYSAEGSVSRISQKISPCKRGNCFCCVCVHLHCLGRKRQFEEIKQGPPRQILSLHPPTEAKGSTAKAVRFCNLSLHLPVVVLVPSQNDSKPQCKR